jgi:hypothetical protein
VACGLLIKRYRPRGNDRAFCVVFIARVPRSSRTSRDFENVLSRLGGGGFVAALTGRNWCNVCGYTGVCKMAANLEMGAFIFLSCSLGVGLDKPQPLVNATRNFDEQVRRVGVFQFVRLFDRVTGFLTER